MTVHVFKVNLKVLRGFALVNQIQPLSCPDVQRTEDHTLGVGPAQSDLARLTLFLPRSLQWRKQSQVRLVLGQDMCARLYFPQFPQYPGLLDLPLRVGIQSI